MYNEIVSWDNICKAYLDLYESFTEKCKGNRYKATTGETLYDVETNVEKTLKEVHEELLLKKPLQPAKYHEIPKPGGGIRGICALPVKERIKCQAIFRVLEPYFEKRYSDYVYSYRSSHPSYYASRSVRRMYLRYFNKNMYILRMDIHKYADFLNHEYLLKVFRKHGVEEKVCDLIKLFLRQPYIHIDTLASKCTGAMQGMVLCSIFYNIYIGHIDEFIGKQVNFYRRVGDDLIIFDPDKEKLLKLKNYIEEEGEKLKISFSKEKEAFGKLNDTEFEFHGLLYKDGKVSMPQKNIDKITNTWKKKLKYNKNLSNKIRISRLKRIFELDNRPNKQFMMHYIRAYNLVTNTQQTQYLSRRFFHTLTKYFTGGLSHKNMAQTKKILKNVRFPTFSKLHYLYTNGRIKK